MESFGICKLKGKTQSTVQCPPDIVIQSVFRPAANVLLDEGFLKHAVMHEATRAKTANNRMLHIV
jgi:hypothetical protein